MKRLFIIYGMCAPAEQQEVPDVKTEMQHEYSVTISEDLAGILFVEKTRHGRYQVYFSSSRPTVPTAYMELPTNTTYLDSKALFEIFGRERFRKPLYRTDSDKSHSFGYFKTIPTNLQEIKDFCEKLREQGIDNCGVNWMLRPGSFSGDDCSEHDESGF